MPCGALLKKGVAPAGEPLEGEVWIGLALAAESRLMISCEIAASESA